ncbi:MAG TPA: hypothetical protein VH641_14865 [Streptosporangiaceae bacterium]|jgi:hypothetical protein
MDTATLLPLLTGPSAAAAVLVWVVWMQRKDIADLRKALDAERRRADTAEEAARTTNTLLASLIDRVRAP